MRLRQTELWRKQAETACPKKARQMARLKALICSCFHTSEKIVTHSSSGTPLIKRGSLRNDLFSFSQSLRRISQKDLLRHRLASISKLVAVGMDRIRIYRPPRTRASRVSINIAFSLLMFQLLFYLPLHVSNVGQIR